MTLVPWAELPAALQVGITGILFIALFVPLSLAAMHLYDYDYFHDSQRALDWYHRLMLLAGTCATIGIALEVLAGALSMAGL